LKQRRKTGLDNVGWSVENGLATLTMSKTKSGFTYLIAAIAAISGLLFGFDIAVINGALIFIRQQFALSEVGTEVATSALLFGCIGGACLAGWLSDRFGRKRVLSSAALLFGASAIAAALPKNILEFEIARIAGGVAVGIASMLAPLYIAEAAPTRLRGRLVASNQLAIVIGILLAYAINWRLSFAGANGWRWMFAIAAIPSVALFAGLFFVPESPRWLVEQGRIDEARDVLAAIEGPADAERVLREVEVSALAGAAPIRDLFRKQMRRPLVVAVGLAILQQLVGINTVLFYGSVIFQQTIFPNSASSALAANITLGGVNLIATLLSMAVIDRMGRRPLLLWSAGLMALCHFTMAWAFRAPQAHVSAVLGAMLLCVAAFAFGLGPGVWVLMAEIFPTRLRGRAMSIANVALWSASLLLTGTFLTIAKHYGISGAFVVYGGICVFTVVFIAALAPETSGLSLEQIEQLWEPNVPDC